MLPDTLYITPYRKTVLETTIMSPLALLCYPDNDRKKNTSLRVFKWPKLLNSPYLDNIMGLPQVRLKVNSMIGVIFSKLVFLSLQKGNNYLGFFVGNLNVVIV